jgi:uncharacterized lipoprotein YmbA
MTKIMKPVLIASACMSVSLMTACMGGSVRYPKYYALDIAPAPVMQSKDERLPAAVAVRRFETPSYLRQGRIVYREAPEEVGFYDYHRWAADPSAAVTTAVISSLRSAGPFSFVKSYDGQDQPEYLLTGRLERLDEIDYGGGVRVEAKLSAELMNLRTGATVWTGEAAETSKVGTRNVNSVVAAMNQAVQVDINRLVAGMKEQLSGSEAASRGGHDARDK